MVKGQSPGNNKLNFKCLAYSLLDYRIMSEYREVLERPKFGFSKSDINSSLDWFDSIGRSIVAKPLDNSFADEADKKFYEVAKFCHTKLIKGNLKHFPVDPDVLSVDSFLEQYENKRETR